MAEGKSFDTLHPAFEEPVTAFMSKDGYQALGLGTGVASAMVHDRAKGVILFNKGDQPRDHVVEVEIRLRRVIPEGEA